MSPIAAARTPQSELNRRTSGEPPRAPETCDVPVDPVEPERSYSSLVELDDRRDPELELQAVALIDTELDGEPGYYDQAWNDPRTVGRAAIVEIVDGRPKVVGAAFAQRKTGEQTRGLYEVCSEELQLRPNADPRLDDTLIALRYAETVGYLAAIAVHPDARRRGFARTMVESRSQLLELLHCDVIWAEGWERDVNISSIPMFERIGWQAITRVENLWTRLGHAAHEPYLEEWFGMHGVPFVDTANINQRRLVDRVRREMAMGRVAEPANRDDSLAR